MKPYLISGCQIWTSILFASLLVTIFYSYAITNSLSRTPVMALKLFLYIFGALIDEAPCNGNAKYVLELRYGNFLGINHFLSVSLARSLSNKFYKWKCKLFHRISPLKQTCSKTDHLCLAPDGFCTHEQLRRSTAIYLDQQPVKSRTFISRIGRQPKYPAHSTW